MTTTVTLIGARGGSGASTVAAALALHTAEDVPTALLTHDPTAMARLLGTYGVVPAPNHPFAVGPRLTVAGLDGPRDAVTIIDAGPAVAAAEATPADGRRYAVLRGPCYLALATLVSLPDLRPDGVILVAEPGRSLSAGDASAVLGIPVVATVPVRSSIARLLDAGLLAGRPSEIPGLGHLSDALVRRVEPFAAIRKPVPDRNGHGLARNGASHAVPPAWGHEL
jgi:hypothetical protein